MTSDRDSERPDDPGTESESADRDVAHPGSADHGGEGGMATREVAPDVAQSQPDEE